MQDTRAILANFIGSTYGDVKQLDKNIVGQSTTLGMRSDEVRKVLEEVMSTSALPSPPTHILPQQAPIVNVVPQQISQVVIPQIQQVVQTTAKLDDSQMWLDLEERDKIYGSLDRLEEKLDLIIKMLKTTK